MQPTLEREVAKPGRPRIGPKAQAAVPQDVYDAIEQEAEARGCNMADVWREVIVDHGYPAWLARGEQ
jgi:hypothetical protein